MNKLRAALGLTALVTLFIGGGIMINPRSPSSRAQIARSPERVPGTIPDEKSYEVLFHRLAFHRKRSAAVGKPLALDTSLQREARLSDNQVRALESISASCLLDVEKQDAEASVIIRAYRARYFPDGKVISGLPLPPPPPELEIMQQRRNAILQHGRDQVLYMLGEATSGQFDSFVKERFGGKVPESYANRIPNPNPIGH